MATEKKILYVITKSNSGGAQKHVFDLATEMSRDFNVTVAAGGNGFLFDKLTAKKIRTLHLESLGRDVDAKKDVSSFITLFRLIKKENPDILHLHSPKAGVMGTVAAFLINLFSGKRPIETIYTVHGFTFNENRSDVEKFFIELITWVTIILSSKTITLSERERNQVRHWPFVEEKLEIIPLGIAMPEFLSKEEARAFLSKKIGKEISSGSFIIGTIAELHQNKGLPYALRALSHIKDDYTYIIVGDGEEREALQEIISSHSLEEKVFLAGHIDSAATIMKAFDIFLLPSLKEGMPYTLIEAGMANLPVIASRVGGIPNMIENSKDGLLVSTKREKEIEQALLYSMENKEKIESMASHFHHKTLENWTLEKMLMNTRSLYKETLN